MTVALSATDGFSRVLDCFTHIRLKIGEPLRFKSLMNMMNLDSQQNILFKVNMFIHAFLINCLVLRSLVLLFQVVIWCLVLVLLYILIIFCALYSIAIILLKNRALNARLIVFLLLSYDVAPGSEITPCNKICKPLVVYRFTGKVMTSITTLRHIDKIITFLRQK